jgi:hypothetical protein
VKPYREIHNLRYDPLSFPEALMQFVAFSALMFVLSLLDQRKPAEPVEILTYDKHLPFAKTNFAE